MTNKDNWTQQVTMRSDSDLRREELQLTGQTLREASRLQIIRRELERRAQAKET